MQIFKTKTLIKFAFVSMVTPLFFNLNGSIYRDTGFNKESFALPVGFFISLFVVFIKRDFIKYFIRDVNVFFIFFIIAVWFSYFMGVTLGSGSSGIQLLLISVLPFIVSYIIGLTVEREFGFHVEDLLSVVVVYCGLFSLIHIFSSFVELGVLESFIFRGADSIFGLFSVYQKVVYYPTILSFIFVFSLYLEGRIYTVSRVIIFFLILMLASRESFLICFLGILSKNYSYYLERKYKRIILFAILAVFFGLLLSQIIPFLFAKYPEIKIIKKLTSLGESGDYSAGRGGAVDKVFNKSSGDYNLFYGTGFSMSRGDLRTPHNQYLELYLRGGILTMIPLLFLLFNSLRNGFIRLKESVKYGSYSKMVYSLWLVLFIYLFISFNINTPMRAPYGAMLLGLVVGYFSSNKNPNRYDA